MLLFWLHHKKTRLPPTKLPIDSRRQSHKAISRGELLLKTFQDLSIFCLFLFAGRELSFVLLFGILFCYCMTFVLVMKPNDYWCGAQKFGIGFCFSICYSALLTKTNRIARIFRCFAFSPFFFTWANIAHFNETKLTFNDAVIK